MLEEGMIFAIEPKIVFPGEGSVGLENMILVTENGYEILTPYPLEIIEIWAPPESSHEPRETTPFPILRQIYRSLPRDNKEGICFIWRPFSSPTGRGLRVCTPG